jgi:NADPH:quinone reductase-like Zn-dependent oxidoreductase
MQPSNNKIVRAARVHEFGSPAVISIEGVEKQQPGRGEVLVRVAAAGVGPWDGWIRAGKSALPQPLPLTLGSDLSGVVEAVGPDVSQLKVGDAVFGVTNPRFVGAHADYAVASVAMVAKKPSKIGHIEAASLPVIAVTAWQALFDQAKLAAGQSVLILGAAGNVGALAIQFAHKAGLKVFATASARDLDRVRLLGADHPIDRDARFEDVVGTVDAVIDLVGGDAQSRSFAILKKSGRLVSAVSQPDQELAARHRVEAGFFLVNVTTAHLDSIAKMVEAGDLVTNVGTVLALEQVAEAHEMMEGARPNNGGKIVLKIGD